MGDVDLVKEVLDHLGDMRWMQVAIKPAKPFAFGLVDGVPVFGLPGNPVSSHGVASSCSPARRSGAWPAIPTGASTARASPPSPPTDCPRAPDGKMHFVRVVAPVGADGRLEVARRPAARARTSSRRHGRRQRASPCCPTATACAAGGIRRRPR